MKTEAEQDSLLAALEMSKKILQNKDIELRELKAAQAGLNAQLYAARSKFPVSPSPTADQPSDSPDAALDLKQSHNEDQLVLKAKLLISVSEIAVVVTTAPSSAMVDKV